MANEATHTPKLARFFSAVPKAFWYVFLAYIALSLILDVAVAPLLDYRYKWSLSLWGPLVFLLAVALGAAGCALARKAPRLHLASAFLTKHGFAVLVCVGGLILFCIQSFLAQGAYFIGTDVDWGIMLMFDDPTLLSSYYSIYPNNHFMGGIFAMVYRFASTIGTGQQVTLLELNCLIVTVALCLGAFTARAIGGTRVGVCTFALLVGFIGFNPHFMVAYTDSFGILFTTAVLCLYTCCKHPAKWPLMAFVAYLGYSLKPTALAIFVGAALVSGCLWVQSFMTNRTSDRSAALQSCPEPSANEPSTPNTPNMPTAALTRPKVLTFAVAAASSLIAVALAAGLVSITRDQVGVRTFPNEGVVPAHYLMMGFNTEYDGMFNNDDRDYSWQYHSKEEMTEADLAVWRSRVQELGPAGLLHLIAKKNLVVYNSGDFLFYRPDPALMDEVIGTNEAVKSFYGIQEPSSGDEAFDAEQVPSPWACIAQVLWYLTLAGVVLCFFRKRPAPAEMAAAIALLLLSGFLLLFECSARYLYLYSPLYVILAVRGWQAFGQWFCAWRAQRALTQQASTGSRARGSA